MKKTRRNQTAFLMGSLLLALGCGRHQETTQVQLPTSPSITSTPHNNTYGRHVFIVKACGTCHGNNGEGQRGLTRSLKEGKFTYEEFRRAILRGVGKMPSYRGAIREKEICCLYRYVVEDVQGKELSSKCESCTTPSID